MQGETGETTGQAPLEFITISGNPEDEAKSETVRTRVKKHVMKDIGLSRRRPKKNKVFEMLINPRAIVGTGDVDPFAPYPIDLGPAERELIANSKQPVFLCGHPDKCCYKCCYAAFDEFACNK
jgi:hypothetical protein